MVEENQKQDKHKEPARIFPFFIIAHWARFAYLGLLGVTCVATAVYGFWQLFQPVTQTTGTLTGLTTDQSHYPLTSYTLLIQTDDNQLHPIRLRNNGRIHTYLQTHPDLLFTRVAIQQQAGVATLLIPLNGHTPPIRETTISPLFLLFTAFLMLILFFPLAYPALFEHRSSATDWS